MTIQQEVAKWMKKIVSKVLGQIWYVKVSFKYLFSNLFYPFPVLQPLR